MHDTRIGRFWSVDPLAGKFPWNSVYAFAENDVIRAIDIEGLEKWITQTSQLLYDPYSLEYVIANNYRPLSDIIQSNLLINAFETAQKSQTFTSLQTAADIVNYIITNDKKGTWTHAKARQINIDNQTSTSTMILELAWEMTNASNARRLRQIENQALEGRISREEYITGKISIEAEAMINRGLVAKELNLYDSFVEKFMDDIQLVKIGKMEKEQLLGKITKYGLSDLSVKLPDGKMMKVSDAYGSQYDLLQKKGTHNE